MLSAWPEMPSRLPATPSTSARAQVPPTGAAGRLHGAMTAWGRTHVCVLGGDVTI